MTPVETGAAKGAIAARKCGGGELKGGDFAPAQGGRHKGLVYPSLQEHVVIEPNPHLTGKVVVTDPSLAQFRCLWPHHLAG